MIRTYFIAREIIACAYLAKALLFRDIEYFMGNNRVIVLGNCFVDCKGD